MAYLAKKLVLRYLYPSADLASQILYPVHQPLWFGLAQPHPHICAPVFLFRPPRRIAPRANLRQSTGKQLYGFDLIYCIDKLPTTNYQHAIPIL
jgi:hypothetical protein